MFRLVTKIKIGEYVFKGAIKTEIIKSYENMTDTATIELPNVIYVNKNKPVAQGSETIEALIKRGDPVWIWTGFDKTYDELSIKFRGFVSRINAMDVITVYCEDYMFVLKNINVPSKRWESVKLKEFIDYVLQDVNIDYDLIDPDINLGTVIIDNNSRINTVQCLEQLKTTYALLSYFNDKTLRVGKFSDHTGTVKHFIFFHNIIRDDLNYRSDEDLDLVIKGISNLDNNTKIERYAYILNGKKIISQAGISGEQITLNYYNKTEKELEQLLTDNFEKYIYKGYTGHFTTLLEPELKPADYVNLYNLKWKERSGKYKVKSVKATTGLDGGFQEVELDFKISDL